MNVHLRRSESDLTEKMINIESSHGRFRGRATHADFEAQTLRNVASV